MGIPEGIAIQKRFRRPASSIGLERGRQRPRFTIMPLKFFTDPDP
jgi:hypothetical protein